MNDVPQDAESPQPSVEDRLTSFFGGNKPEPKQAPEPVSQEAPEPQEAEPSQDQQEPQAPETAEEEASQDAEPYAELEHLGKKYSVPESLKNAFEANRAQSTRTTQELAHVRKAIETEKIALQATQAFQNETRELDQQMAQLQSYKDQAKRIDWTQLTTDQKIDLDRELRNIDSQMGELKDKVSAKKAEHRQNFNRLVVEAVAQTEQYMGKKVKGWNENTGRALHDYGTQLGIPTEKLTTGWFADPVATHVMWKAQQWDQLQAAKPAVANKASNAPPVIKPTSPVATEQRRTSVYKEARASLRKSGSVEDFASALLAAQKVR